MELMSDGESDVSSQFTGLRQISGRMRGLTIESSQGGTFLDNENAELKRKVMELENTVRRNEEELISEKQKVRLNESKLSANEALLYEFKKKIKDQNREIGNLNESLHVSRSMSEYHQQEKACCIVF